MAACRDVVVAPDLEAPEPQFVLVPPACDGASLPPYMWNLVQSECDDVVAVLTMLLYGYDYNCRALAQSATDRWSNNWLRKDPFTHDYGYYNPGGDPRTYLGNRAWDNSSELLNTVIHEEAHHQYGPNQGTATYWGDHCANVVFG